MTCTHDWYMLTFKRNIYGDEINTLNARSVWLCRCGEFIYSERLYREPSIQALKRQVREVLRGKEYFDLLEKTAARVEKWPEWKKGERSMRRSDIEV